MGYAIGVILAVAVSLFARWVGFDRDRSFYPVVLVVIAVLYDLFAVMGGSTHALLVESLMGTVFIVAAVVGFKRDLRIVAVGLAAHGILDFFHGQIVTNPGVPVFWPPFCGAYDVTAGAILWWLSPRGGSLPKT